MTSIFTRIKRAIRCQSRHLIYYIARHTNRDWADHVRFYQTTGYTLDYHNPQTLDAKLMWLNRYYIPKSKVDCTDKISMRDFLQTLDLNNIYTPTIYGVWDNAKHIVWQELPEQFVLKCNHGCGMNIVVRDKKRINIEQTIHTLNTWLKIDYSKVANEYHYHYIKPKVFAEEYLSDVDTTGNIVDYKLMCGGGNPLFFIVCRERTEKGHPLLSSYTLDWKRAHLLINEDPTTIEKPKNINTMFDAAKQIAKHFPFVRVDFYNNYDKVYIGELTFTPHACLLDYCTDETLKKYGNEIPLPCKVNDFV